MGKKGFGINLRELGGAAGGMDYMSVSAAVERLEARAEKGTVLSAALNRCDKGTTNVECFDVAPIHPIFVGHIVP